MYRNEAVGIHHAQELGELLIMENVASVQYRYDDHDIDDLPGAKTSAVDYRFTRQWYGKTTPVQLIKAAHCYTYQSCEHPGWETSPAKAFIDDLIDSAIHAIPGYDSAAWDIDELAA
jgi:hypothetical protein